MSAVAGMSTSGRVTGHNLDTALGSAQRLLVDTTTLIAFLNAAEHAHPLARHVMSRIESDADPIYAYYSVITAAELLVRPLRASVTDLTYIHTFLTGFPHLSPLPIDMQVALQAANIRATTNIRLPDAMIVASGLLAGCEAIICNDKQWKNRLAPLFTAFRWIYLGDYV